MLLFVYTTTHKGFVIFTCRYFKLSRNTTALSQSNCRNFSCSSIRASIVIVPCNFPTADEPEEKSEETGNQTDDEKTGRPLLTISQFMYYINERFYGHCVTPL